MPSADAQHSCGDYHLFPLHDGFLVDDGLDYVIYVLGWFTHLAIIHGSSSLGDKLSERDMCSIQAVLTRVFTKTSTVDDG